MKTVGIYARVSTMDQHPENQALELRRVAAARGWEIYNDHVFTDKGISGAKGEDERPALREVMDLARRHKIHVVLVWEFSRFARSTAHLLAALENFRLWNVDFVSVQQNVDTTTANGRLMYGVIALFAEWERANGIERTHLGLARARSEGTVLGRPSISRRQKKSPVDPEAVRFYKTQNPTATVREIGSVFKIGKSTAADLVRQTPPEIIALHHRGEG